MGEAAYITVNESTCHKVLWCLQMSDRQERFGYLCICTFAELNFGTPHPMSPFKGNIIIIL